MPRASILSIATCLLVLLTGTASTTSAAGQLHVGLMAHDVPALWSGFRRESGVDLNLEWTSDWPGKKLGPGQLGSQVGLNLNSEGHTSYAYAGLHLRFGESCGWYGRIGLGGAVHNGETALVANDRKALGSQLLFHIPLELGYQWKTRSLALYFSHISNGYTQDSNEGLDTLGVRFGWRQ